MLETGLRNPKFVEQQPVDGNLSDARLNVPALLAIKVWMAMLETGLSVPNTVDQQSMDGKLSDAHLNVPTLLVIDLPMAKSGLCTQH